MRSEPGSEAVAEQSGSSQTVLFRTNTTVSLETNNEGENEVFSESMMPEESEGSKGKCDENRVDETRHERNKSNDMRGMRKRKWTSEERIVLWECYVRSRMVEPNGHIMAIFGILMASVKDPRQV